MGGIQTCALSRMFNTSSTAVWRPGTGAADATDFNPVRIKLDTVIVASNASESLDSGVGADLKEAV
jgi:hypothetical protein